MKVVLFIFILLGGCEGLWAGTAEVDHGKELYLAYGCALCHGWQGEGNGINAQKFQPPPTNFHVPQAYFHGSDRDSIRRSIQNGIKEDNSIMPAFDDIPASEVDLLIDYLQSLQQRRDR